MDEQMIDHERIWLQPKCCASEFDGRQWCQDNVFDECEEGAKATEYVRADIIAGKVAELTELLVRTQDAIHDVVNGDEPRFGALWRAIESALAPHPERRSE